MGLGLGLTCRVSSRASLQSSSVTLSGEPCLVRARARARVRVRARARARVRVRVGARVRVRVRVRARVVRVRVRASWRGSPIFEAGRELMNHEVR